MKFFLDANIPYSTLGIFKELDLQVIHARDIGLGRATDEEIFEYALKNKHILITKDLEFGKKALSAENPYGIIILRLPPNFKADKVMVLLKYFLNSVDLRELEKSLAIVKLGIYRIRKLKQNGAARI